MLSRAILLSLAACVLLASSCAGNTLAPPLIAPPTAAPFKAADLIPADRTAYVGIHFEDYSTSQLSGHDSTTSLQGIRTMMASVRDPRRGGSKRDRVVLVPMHTPISVREQFEADGIIVLEMDNALPHQDICAPKFDRIYLWSRALADRYDRVVYLDWDVIAQRNMDHLFLCGQFCMVYNSILHFVDGLMVVKPDPAVFDAMVAEYRRDRTVTWTRRDATKKAEAPAAVATTDATAAWSTPSKTFCWERSYLFFLEWFGNMEAAPLFDAKYGQSPLPLQRLDASAQLNAMMWYEKYSWTLMRGRGYRNMTDDQEVPALSLGFTTLKPFHWAPGIFFNLGWEWSDLRDEYLGTSHTWFAVSRLMVWVLLLAVATKGLRKCMIAMYARRSGSAASGFTGKAVAFVRAVHMKVFGPTDGYVRVQDGVSEELVFVPATVWSLSGYWLPAYGSDILGVFFGTCQMALLGYLLTAYTSLIPIMTSPHVAWRIWFMFHVLGVYAVNHWIFLGYHACPPLMTAANGAESIALTGRSSPNPSSAAMSHGFPLSSVFWLAGWEVITYVLMHRTFYPEFVVKMFVLFPLVAAMLIATINVNRAVWRSIEQAKHGLTAKEANSPSAVPLLPTATTYRG